MSVPLSQVIRISSYVLKHRLLGNKRYPLVLMLEPLFRCNLECAGCGKIQYPEEILKKRVSPAEAFKAAEECGAPVVSIAGGEPLIHPEMTEIVEGLIARGKYVYLCTNALLLERKLDLFKPNKHLTFSVHLDGLREDHDKSVCRPGTYDTAVKAIKEAIRRGFRVTTNTTLFNDAQPERVRAFFDEMMVLGVEGVMVSPGYPYSKAPEQDIFLERNKTKALFRQILGNRKKHWRFNLSPNFLAFLQGKIDYDCTPWGNPTYNVFGWQKPCYLLQDGYATSFKELMETTDWKRYGQHGTDPRCKDCMVHSGYEPSSVNDTFSLGGMIRTVRFMLNPDAKGDPTAAETAPVASKAEKHECGCGSKTSCCSSGESKEPATSAKK